MSRSTQLKRRQFEAEFVNIPATELMDSHVALGTRAMAARMWGGTDESESIATNPAALDQRINLIDRAPMYGFGMFEAIDPEETHT
jgi:aryl-alcohol dehydrogenase-like predicted oxidoreductase